MLNILLAAILLSPPAHKPRPNIIMLYADDHAAHAVSAYRQFLPYSFPLPATPNIDRIARNGMLFTNAFVTNSICGPARAALFTGQYGHLTGVMTNNDSLHSTVITFPKMLQRGGYETAVIGKWHLKDRPTGFDHYEIMPGQGTYYNPVLISEKDSTRYTGYSQAVLTDHALEWMRGRTTSKPYFLLLGFNAPHRPWESGPDQLPLYRDTTLAEPATLFDDGSGRAFRWDDPQMTVALDLIDRDLKLVDPVDMNATQLLDWRKWYDPENNAFRSANLSGRALVRWKYQRFIKDYMRAVAGVDQQVGRILAAAGPNTIIIYSSDQGFFLGDHGWFDKRMMYEESLRSPLLIQWPGVIKAGSVNTDLVMNLDFAQTFLDVAGVKAAPEMQGLSFAPLLEGHHPKWRDAIYYQYFAYPDWHMVQRQYGVRDKRYKLIRYYEVDKWELFDLANDPQELRSVYNDPSYAAVVARMKRKLTALRTQYREPAQDLSPHTPFTLPADYRRSGKAP